MVYKSSPPWNEFFTGWTHTAELEYLLPDTVYSLLAIVPQGTHLMSVGRSVGRVCVVYLRLHPLAFKS